MDIAKTPKPTAQPTDSTEALFDRIAGRYDLLNRVLSFGLDMLWRRKVARTLDAGDKARILDLATGTAEMLISCLKHNTSISEAVGIDVSAKMLQIARKKIDRNKLSSRARLIRAETTDLGFAEGYFDIVTIGFGIRNFTDKQKALTEIRRVMKNRGQVVILEFSLPRKRLVRQLYLFYLRNIIPFIGGLFSGSSAAYRHLNTTIEQFPCPDDYCTMLKNSGFSSVKARSMTFGIVCVYTAEKDSGFIK